MIVYHIRWLLYGVPGKVFCLDFGIVKEESLEDLLDVIGIKLTELRKKKGYKSHETFSYDHELPRMHYWRIENGKTNITLKSLLRILAIHNLSFEDFVAQLPKKTERKTKGQKKSS